MKRMFALLGIVLLCSLLLIPHVIAERTISSSEYVLKIYGNANKDDIIDMRDVTYIKLVIFGKKPETEFCDANYDGKVSMLDVVQTKLIIVGKAGEITIVDLVDRTVTVQMPIKKVALLYGLEDYAAVGGEEALNKIVALNSWRYKQYRPDWWQAWVMKYPWIEDIPDTGQPGKNFNVEVVINAEPDVAIADAFMYEKMPEDIERLEHAGISIVFTDYFPHSENVDELYEQTWDSTMILGTLLGNTERARELVSFFEEQINAVVSKVEGIESRPKAIVLTTWSEWRAYGQKGMYNYWIIMAGGENIGAKVVEGSSGDISPEFILEENPNVIIFTCNNNFPSGQKVVIGYTVSDATAAKDSLQELIDRPGWEALSAVQNKNVYMIHHGLSHGHLFEFVALQAIAKWLHPETFKDVNPEESLKTFYEEFLPLPYKGVWIVSIGGE